MNGKFVFNGTRTQAKLGDYVAQKQRALDIQVAKDSDQFVPMREGRLKDSVQTSDYGKGKVQWTAPHARRMYYGVNYRFSTEKHSRATHHWFEKAKALYKKDWLKLVNK